MLARQGIVEAADAEAIAKGLAQVKGEIEAGTFSFSRALEDIHMNVESRLERNRRPRGGAAAHRALAQRPGRRRLPALGARRDRRDPAPDRRNCSARSPPARSRAPPWSCRASPICNRRSRSPSAIISSPMSRCWRATPGRFKDARKRLNECPLGAAALAGTSFPIDRDMTAKALGFDRPTANSLDSVADRDFALEALARRSDRGDASLPLRRGDRAVDDAAIRLRQALRRLHDRLVDHAAEAQSRRGRTRARQDGPDRRRARSGS